jgi:CheY-like chemotaxis protein
MWQQRRAKVILDVEAGQTGLSTRKLVLESFGYNVLAAASGRDALALLEKHEIHGAVVDTSANDVPLPDLTSRIKHSRHVPVVLAADSSFIAEDLHETVDASIEKLSDPKTFVEAMDKLLGFQ